MTAQTGFHVLYTQVDIMGIVHHSYYPLWFEIGREDYLKKAGMSNFQLNKRGLYLPLSKIECNYKSPAKFGDKIVVTTRITSLSSARIKFQYEVLEKGKGRLIAIGRTIHAWTNRNIEPINIIKTAPDVYWQLKQFEESNFTTNKGIN